MIIADWLIELDITHLLASGISKDTVEYLSDNDVDVTWKLPRGTAEYLVKTYLENHLVHGKNVKSIEGHGALNPQPDGEV